MPTTPRDQMPSPVVRLPSEAPTKGSLAPTAAVAGAARNAWRDPVQRIDEIGLLISAAVFSGLLQVPGHLTEW